MVVKFQQRYCKTLQASNAVGSDVAKPAPVRNEFWFSGRYTYHYFRVWRNTNVWVHLYHGDREKPVTRLSSACSQAKLGLDLQAWIGGLLKGQPPTPGPKTLACGHAAP
jgi:hypothetical protein